jgi:type III secretion system FlhB-like substrate exporter
MTYTTMRRHALTKKQKERVGPAQKLRHDDLGDTFPRDVYEAVAVFVALLAIGAGAVALYHLSTLT